MVLNSKSEPGNWTQPATRRALQVKMHAVTNFQSYMCRPCSALDFDTNIGEGNCKTIVKDTDCDGGLVSNIPAQLLFTFINYMCHNH